MPESPFAGNATGRCNVGFYVIGSVFTNNKDNPSPVLIADNTIGTLSATSARFVPDLVPASSIFSIIPATYNDSVNYRQMRSVCPAGLAPAKQ